MVELGAMMHAESRFNVLTYSGDKIAALISWLIETDQFAVVAEVNGEVVGGFLGAAFEHWASDDMFAYDYILFIEPARRGSTAPLRMIKSFRAWAKAKGCKMITVGISTGVNVEMATALYEAAGFERVGVLLDGAT